MCPGLESRKVGVHRSFYDLAFRSTKVHMCMSLCVVGPIMCLYACVVFVYVCGVCVGVCLYVWGGAYVVCVCLLFYFAE